MLSSTTSGVQKIWNRAYLFRTFTGGNEVGTARLIVGFKLAGRVIEREKRI